MRRVLIAVATILTLTAAAVWAQTRFPDVPANHEHAAAIEHAADKGWFSGYEDGTFRPDRKITAEQAARVFGNAFPDGVTRGEFANILYIADGQPAGDSATTTTTASQRTGSLGVRIEPEDCSGYTRSFYQSHGTSWSRLGGVGYLTGQRLASGDVDHVVALEEAWCSGIRSPDFGRDSRNHRASSSSVNRGKGGHDPREWWATGGSTTPSRVSYPGWCDYLQLHVDIKIVWQGTMDQAEHDFLVDQLDDCEDDGPVATTSTP